VVDHVNNGEKVKIHCTRVDGSGTVWDDISGNGRFVSDRYVKTGQTAPVAPPCDGPAPAGPGGPSPAAADHADALQAPADPGPSPALADPKVLITVEEDPNDQGGCCVGGPFGGLCKLGGIFHRGIHWSSEKIMDVVKPCAAGAGTAALSNMIVATAAGTGRWELLVAAAAVGCVMGILKGDGLVPVPPLPGR
jgi:hypothetical protein